MRQKYHLKKFLSNGAIFIAGLLILGGLFIGFQQAKAASSLTWRTNPDCFLEVAKDDTTVRGIPAECENKDVVLDGGTWDASAVRIWQEDQWETDPNDPRQRRIQFPIYSQCTSDHPDCDTKRHFKSLTLTSNWGLKRTILTHDAVNINTDFYNGQPTASLSRKKVDLEISGQLLIAWPTSQINVDGKGYPGGLPNHWAGYGPGGGRGIETGSQLQGALAGTGGSWAGQGGAGYCLRYNSACGPDISIDTITNNGITQASESILEADPYLFSALPKLTYTTPIDINNDGNFQFGSGGGGAKLNNVMRNGSAGGGRIRIVATGGVFLNGGQISANGQKGNNVGDSNSRTTIGGAGSGGTIMIDTPRIEREDGSSVNNANVKGGVSFDGLNSGNMKPSMGFPHYGTVGQVHAPQSITPDNTRPYQISAVGGDADVRINSPVYAGAGGGGIVVLKGIGLLGHWDSPPKKKVIVQVLWHERKGDKNVVLSSIIVGKPKWIVDDNTLISKNLGAQNQKTINVVYTARKDEYSQESQGPVHGGIRICATDTNSENNYYCYYYRDVVRANFMNPDFDQTDISSDKSGNLYISFADNGRVYTFSPKFEFIRKFTFDPGVAGDAPNEGWPRVVQHSPQSIAVNPEAAGNMYILIADNNDDGQYSGVQTTAGYRIAVCPKNTLLRDNCRFYNFGNEEPKISDITPNSDIRIDLAYTKSVDSVFMALAKRWGNNGDYPPPFIAKLSLNDNDGLSHIATARLTNNPNDSGIFANSVGLTAAGDRSLCRWDLDLTLNSQSCQSTDVRGNTLDIVSISNGVENFITNARNDVLSYINLVSPGTNATYNGIGGGGITYFDGKIAF